MLRMIVLATSLLISTILALSTSGARVDAADAEKVAPPLARAERKASVQHGRERRDDYAWLARRDDPEVLAHLAAENRHAQARLAPLQPLIEEVAAELRARNTSAERSVPYLDNGHVYSRRFDQGAQYPVITRTREAPGATEETVLDVPALAAGHIVYRLNRWQVSPDGRRVAFAVDLTGARQHRIFVRDITTGEIIDDGITDAGQSLAFAADGRTLFYVRNEPKTVRSYQVRRHLIGTPADQDVVVYEETDPTFEVWLRLAKSRRFVLIESNHERSSETLVVSADRPDETPRVIEPRRPGMRYHVDHVASTFFIRTDLDAPDYRVVSAPDDSPGAENWRDLVPHRLGRFLWRAEPFADFVAVDEEHDGRYGIRVVRLSDRHEFEVPQPATIGVATTNFMFGGFGGNREPNARVLRFRHSGPLQPERVFDFDMVDRTLTAHDSGRDAAWLRPDLYTVERIDAIAPDGESVPVTLVWRNDLRRPGGNPTLVTGYGAYGFSERPIFSDRIFSLLDRGFVYALAHVRGGREKGERWYEQGRLLNKRNTFTDFIAVAEALKQKGYADPRALFAQGRSAGGLLVGAVANMRPDLFAGIVAEVPFVDVVSTASDPQIPLTTLEYEEWGHPSDAAEYEVMMSYSPYDNVAPRPYPPMFVTAAYHDTQVSYAEPAKWVARLRALGDEAHEIVFTIDMRAGHGGRSGRLGPVQDTAEIMGWLLAKAGYRTAP